MNIAADSTKMFEGQVDPIFKHREPELVRIFSCSRYLCRVWKNHALASNSVPQPPTIKTAPALTKTGTGSPSTKAHVLRATAVGNTLGRAPRPPRPRDDLPPGGAPPEEPRDGEEERDGYRGDSEHLRPPSGGMLLSSPGVISQVTERAAEQPAPMKVSAGSITETGVKFGGSGVQRKDRERLAPRPKEAPGGGFPAVRHRSEMGHVRLGRASRNTR